MRKVTLCYIIRDGKWLMLYRNKKKNDPNAGKWIGVGGGIEAGETPEEGMLREVWEETGLRLTKWHYYGVIEFRNDAWEYEDMYLYSASDYEGEVEEGEESCNEGTLRWIEEEDILKLNLWEGDIPFLKAMIAGQERIHLRLVYHEDKLTDVIDLDQA